MCADFQSHAHRTHFGNVSRTHLHTSFVPAYAPAHFSKQNSKEEKLFYILKIVKLKKKYERPYLAVIYARNHSTFLNFWRICLHKNRTRARMEMCAHANSLL